MILHFYLRFSTHFGQSISVSGNTAILGDDSVSNALPLQYLNDQLWHTVVEIDPAAAENPIRYKYILRDKSGEDIIEFGDDRIIEMAHLKVDKLELVDTWNAAGEFENTFFTQPFQQVLLKKNKPANGPQLKKTGSHWFKVKAPLLKENEVVCLTGSGTVLQNWDTDNPKLLYKEENWWSVKLDLFNEPFPITYKYGVYNIKDKKFVRFEEGNNRSLIADPVKKSFSIVHDGFIHLPNNSWKGAGVAIPVFSLRSKKSFGTGEFTDLKLLVNWARKTGLKLIQLLPVNDTTSMNTRKDSYPYSAISAFALHPLYINLEEVAGVDSPVIQALSTKKRQLNKSPEMDYEKVMQYKTEALKKIYKTNKKSLKSDTDYFSFFELNRHWLVPYAVFCYLRDKNGTADFDQWKDHNVYDEDAIQELADPSKKHYDEIALHYFIQYHLHLQLKAASAYAHKNGIVIKGDIPIGIGKSSVDAWMEPALYNMNEQAGAPPDLFAIKGQNWGFPTYNWKKMQEDDFTWWRQRFEQMSAYFDAFRIDHILGFFRIWSIPASQVEGLMGRFVPAIPVRINELFERGISFDRHRYTQPYVTEGLLQEWFGEKADAVKEEFFHDLELKPAFDTQQKIEAHFAALEDADQDLKEKLFDVVSNVIFFEEEGSLGQQFHFRIGMEETSSFRQLDTHSQQKLKELYLDYFYKRQDDLWRKEALHKLPGLKQSTNMLVCGEDLGMVPHCVPEVMEQTGILSLEIQRMPKKPGIEFFHPADAPYLSVVTPSTHDMSTVREWWEEDPAATRRFYNKLMGHFGDPPTYCEPWISKEILIQHLYSPAMWSIFQLQDLLGISADLRREHPADERINVPADPNHYWNYRMHINLEDLAKATAFNEELQGYVEAGGR